MAIKKERRFKKLISMAASIFLLFLFLTAGQCPAGTDTALEDAVALEPTADGIAMNHDDTWYFNRYTEDQYFVVGSGDDWNWPYNPDCCGSLYFVSLLRFDQSALEGRNVAQAFLYLNGFDEGGEGSSLSETLKVDRIAAEWDFATEDYDDAIQPGFVTPGDTVELALPIAPAAGPAGTDYAIDVTAIVQDWATSGGNYGFRLMANQNPADEKRVRFRSSRYSADETKIPRLAIEFVE